MNYIFDPDLEFLADCSKEELNCIVEVINEMPFNGLHIEKGSCQHKAIIQEIHRMGSNTISRLFHKITPITYRKFLCNVCDEHSIKYDKNATIQQIEFAFLNQVLFLEELDGISSLPKLINVLTHNRISRNFMKIKVDLALPWWLRYSSLKWRVKKDLILEIAVLRAMKKVV